MSFTTTTGSLEDPISITTQIGAAGQTQQPGGKFAPVVIGGSRRMPLSFGEDGYSESLGGASNEFFGDSSSPYPETVQFRNSAMGGSSSSQMRRTISAPVPAPAPSQFSSGYPGNDIFKSGGLLPQQQTLGSRSASFPQQQQQMPSASNDAFSSGNRYTSPFISDSLLPSSSQQHQVGNNNSNTSASASSLGLDLPDFSSLSLEMLNWS